MKKKPESTQKKQGGATKWAKGQSGNIKGKPKGSLNKVTLAVQSLLDNEAEGLTRKAIELALEGDLVAVKLCLDRIIPVRKSRPVKIDLPDVSTGKGVSEAQVAVVQAVGQGELTPEEAQILSSILDARRKSIEVADIELRLDKLERLDK